MNVVIFVHPNFLGSTSMPLFADALCEGLRAQGHDVAAWSPAPFFHRLPCPQRLKKWLGYLDQYLLFPLSVRVRLRRVPHDTLFIFTDQALGPWVPLVADRPHVVHCHDFLALRSALGEVPRNPVSWTGRVYQKWIRAGFRHGRNFISVSARTRDELRRFLGEVETEPKLSVMVPNGLNHPYRPLAGETARSRLQAVGFAYPDAGFILHVGGNQWYKNRDGVLAIYAAYVEREPNPLPLLMLGAEPNTGLRSAAVQIPSPGKVAFVVRPPVEILEASYSAAAVLLFPSHAEGFGWPILEAMACGCPVLTTEDAPMTEVGADIASYLPVAPPSGDCRPWAGKSADLLLGALSRTAAERQRIRDVGIDRAQGFSASLTIKRYIDVYARVLENANG